MTHPVWPEALDRWERDGWQVQPQEARQQRKSDTGPPGWRRRFSAAAKTVGLSIVLTRDEKAVFDQFFEVTCARGARLFWMPDPTTDGWPMLDSAGRPLLSGDQPLRLSARWLVSFAEQLPVETMVEQVRFRKTFNVVVMP